MRTRARIHRMSESINTRTQQKQKQHNDYWQQHTGPTAVAAARSIGGGAAAGAASYERASYRPFDDSVPWWLCVAVRERTRRAHTQSKTKVSTLFTQQKQQQQHNDYSQQQQTGPTVVVAAARKSSGGSATGAASYDRESPLSFV